MITAENVYKRLFELKNIIEDKEQIKKIDDFAHNYQGGVYVSNFVTEFALILKWLKNEIAVNSAKTDKTDKLFKLAKNITKIGVKNGIPVLGFGLLLDRFGDNNQYFCDGYRLLSLSKHFDSIENYSEEDVLRCDKIMPKDTDFISELKKPNLQDLKTYNKICAAEKNVLNSGEIVYDFGAKHPVVNGQWLAQALEAIPNARIYETALIGHDKNKYCSQIVLVDEAQGIKMLILGMRVDKTNRTETDLKAVL